MISPRDWKRYREELVVKIKSDRINLLSRNSYVGKFLDLRTDPQTLIFILKCP